MTGQFRVNQPKRSYTGPNLSPYNKYKSFLKTDFNSRCGYTDCPDFWFGGVSTFHVDHFKPKSIHIDLIEDYNNLIYCCSHVNQAKSADNSDYLDPCVVDYNEHFFRDERGRIFPKESSPQAMYMYKKLKLYLKRYGAIWVIDQLYQRMKLIKEIVSTMEDSEGKNELVLIMGELGLKFVDYLDYLEANR